MRVLQKFISSIKNIISKSAPPEENVVNVPDEAGREESLNEAEQKELHDMLDAMVKESRARLERGITPRGTPLEDLEKQGDINIKLDTIFNDISMLAAIDMARGEAAMQASNTFPEDDNVILHPKTKALEEYRQMALNELHKMPQNPGELIDLFIRARELRRQRTPCTDVKKYNAARKAINQVLKDRGIDITVC